MTKAKPRYEYDYAERLNPLQDRFHAEPTHANWCALYLEITVAARVAVVVYLKEKGLRFSSEKRRDILADTSVYIANRFKQNPTYAVKDWFKVFNNTILYLVHNKKQQFADRINSEPYMDEFADRSDRKEYNGKNPANYLTVLCSDPTIDGRRIVVDLGTTQLDPRKMPHNPRDIPQSTFRVAIQKIAVYTPKESIYRYAVELKGIFDTLRGPETFKRGKQA